MKPESEPVADDELVIRFVWKDFFRPGNDLPVRPRAFQPRDDETTGISVYRAACLAQPTEALTVIAPDKRSSYALAALSVADLRALGITVRPDPIPKSQATRCWRR